MAGGAVYVPPTPYTPGGGGRIRKNFVEDPIYDDDLVPIIQAFLEKIETG